MLAAAIGVAMFSLSAPTTKLVLGDSSTLFTAAGRGAIAGVVAGVLLLAGRAPAPNRDLWPRLTVVALGVVIGFPLLTAWGLQSVPSAHGAIVIALLPLATVGLGSLLTGERPSASYWTCSAVGVGAVTAFVAVNGHGTVQFGDLLLGLAVLAAACGYAYGAVLSSRMPGWQVICWALVALLPVTLPLTAIGLGGAGAPDRASSWLAFVYTAVGSQLVGFFFWYRGLARAGIARAGQVQLVQPMLSLVWAWPLVGEPLTAPAVATALVVFAAVAVGRRTAVRRTVGAPPAPAGALVAVELGATIDGAR